MLLSTSKLCQVWRQPTTKYGKHEVEVYGPPLMTCGFVLLHLLLQDQRYVITDTGTIELRKKIYSFEKNLRTVATDLLAAIV